MYRCFQKEVRIPFYDRAKVKAGIVHVCIGGFHKAHQAFFIEELLENFGVTGFEISGIALSQLL